jgi:hypothetical protein
VGKVIEIRRADEIADFTSHLSEIDDIFFESSARRDFCNQEEKQSFREMSLGRYIAKHRDSFFVALDDGRCVRYLAGCLKNPTKLTNDVSYFRYIEDICQDYPAHLHINIAERYRNRGLGATLVERFADWANLHSVGGIQIVTSSAS